MHYTILKMLHLISAAVLLTAIIYCYTLWKKSSNPRFMEIASQQIQTQTWLVILPAAFFQIMTGFTMISLKHLNYSDVWITNSIVGFIVMMGSWLSFIYFLTLSQQLVTEHKNKESMTFKFKFFRRIQSTLLIACLASLFSMIFFMANKV